MTEKSTDQATSAVAPDDDEKRTVVRTQGVKKIYTMGSMEVQALRGVDLEIYSGEYMSIMGPSGSGKSTLFNMVGGLDKPSEGKVYIDEVDVAQLDAYELAWLRCRKIGYIFQTFNIIPVMTALENVTLPMIFAGASNDEAIKKGRELLDIVGLGDRWQHKPTELSGGQQQRVAVARALSVDPLLILADEPTANLDTKNGEQIMDIMKKLNEETNTTFIFATHDPRVIKYAKRIVTLEDGKIVKDEEQ